MATKHLSLCTLLLTSALAGCDSPEGVIVHDGRDDVEDNGVIVHDADPCHLDNGVIVHDAVDECEVDNGVIVHDETDDSAARTDAALGLLARVEVQPGELLEIYEPQRGVIVVSGAGAPTSAARITPHAIQGRTLAQLWADHVPGVAMPPALAATAARMADVPLAAEGTRPARVTSDVADLTAAPRPSGAAGYCDAGFYGNALSDCSNAPWDTDVAVCLDDWSGGAWAKADASQWTESVVCPAQGTVVMRLSGDVETGVWTVPQNTYRNVQVYVGCGAFWETCPRVRVDIEQASGDRFQFRFLSDVK